MRAILFAWAGAATIFALYFGLQDRPEPRVSRDAQELSVERRKTRVLERRVETLQEALAASIDPAFAEAAEPAAAARIAAYLRFAEADEWNVRDATRMLREIYALLMADAKNHRVVMDLLAEAATGDDAYELTALLVENPFVRASRSSEVTASIRKQARAMLTEAEPHRRTAAARVLFGYDSVTRDDVLLGIERLGAETDAGVRDTLLEVLADHGRGVALTDAEAAPFLDALRDHLGSGRSWTASAIADWSSDEADLDRFRAGFRAAADASTREEYLNGFRADSRMGGRRADECRSFLLDVLADPAIEDSTRDLALEFLRGYAPWDAATADAIRRAR